MHVQPSSPTNPTSPTSPTSPPFGDGAATWNRRFQGDDYLFGREPNEYLRVRASHLRPGGRVLCVADGEGRNSVWLAQQGFEVEAFDFADVAVAKARRLAEEAGVSVALHVSDCERWAWRAQAYDAVVGVFFQFAAPAQREVLFRQMVTALKPGGHLLIQGYTPRQLEFRTGGPGDAAHLYTPELLRKSFADLDIIELVEYDAALNEGARHVGMSALVGLVAQKR